jgi:hypothetical protein
MKLFKTSSTAILLLAACLGFGQTATKYTVLHDFGGTVSNGSGGTTTDGYGPQAGVTIDSTGNMFGVTRYTGLNNGGIVWEITASGTYKVLHEFAGTVVNADGATGPDGTLPLGRLAFDKTGNMYGTTYQGGAKNLGMLWEITTAGTYLDLHDFGGTAVNLSGTSRPDGTYPDGGVSFDSAGNMYGTTDFGGANPGSGSGKGTVWEITKIGQYLDIHDFGGTTVNASGTSGPDGSVPAGEITFDSAGNMYGTAEEGGPNPGLYSEGGGMVWEMTTSGSYKDLHDFGGTIVTSHGASGPDGTVPDGEVAFDSAGNMYGIAEEGGPNLGRYSVGDGMLWEIPKTGSYKDLHDFGGAIVDAEGNSAIDGSTPGGITVDSAGNIFGVAESGGPCKLYDGFPAGILWEKMKTGVYKDLHDFGATAGYPGGKDGSWPNGVTIDSAGDLVGTTFEGGTGTNTYLPGTVRKLATVPVSLQSFTLTPNAVIGGTNSTGRITLSNAAPIGGFVVTLTSSNPSAMPPVSVTVPERTGSVSFSLPTSAVSTAVSATITATFGSISLTAPLAIHPAYVVGLSVSPTSEVGGARCVATVTLNGPAPAGGWGVRLTCTSSSVKIPTYVVVPAGATTATFQMATYSVASTVTATITGTLNSFSKSTQLTVTP